MVFLSIVYKINLLVAKSHVATLAENALKCLVMSWNLFLMTVILIYKTYDTILWSCIEDKPSCS